MEERDLFRVVAIYDEQELIEYLDYVTPDEFEEAVIYTIQKAKNEALRQAAAKCREDGTKNSTRLMGDHYADICLSLIKE